MSFCGFDLPEEFRTVVFGVIALGGIKILRIDLHEHILCGDLVPAAFNPRRNWRLRSLRGDMLCGNLLGRGRSMLRNRAANASVKGRINEIMAHNHRIRGERQMLQLPTEGNHLIVFR